MKYFFCFTFFLISDVEEQKWERPWMVVSGNRDIVSKQLVSMAWQASTDITPIPPRSVFAFICDTRSRIFLLSSDSRDFIPKLALNRVASFCHGQKICLGIKSCSYLYLFEIKVLALSPVFVFVIDWITKVCLL